MNKLTKEEVKHIAHLARIRLNEEEVTNFQEQLTEVIEYNINVLAELDVEGVVPTSQTTGLTNVWRDDEVGESLPLEDVLSQAAAVEDGQFMVKKVLGEE